MKVQWQVIAYGALCRLRAMKTFLLIAIAENAHSHGSLIVLEVWYQSGSPQQTGSKHMKSNHFFIVLSFIGSLLFCATGARATDCAPLPANQPLPYSFGVFELRGPAGMTTDPSRRIELRQETIQIWLPPTREPPQTQIDLETNRDSATFIVTLIFKAIAGGRPDPRQNNYILTSGMGLVSIVEPTTNVEHIEIKVTKVELMVYFCLRAIAVAR